MLIRAGRLFDGDRMIPGMAVRIHEGRVMEMSDALTARPGEDALDMPRALIAPGFVDVHIHGIAGSDTMNGEAHVRRMAKSVAKHGVTAFLPTTMAASMEDTRAALEGVAGAMKSEEGARVLGCHMEGPFLNAKRCGAQPPQFIVDPSLGLYQKITSGLGDVVKLITLAPEQEGALSLIDSLRGKVALSAGHTDAACELMHDAAARGLSQITHMFNGMNALSHRAPGVPGAALSDERLSLQLIADLLHLHPDALALCHKAKGAAGCILITDAMEATDMPDGEYALGANRVFVKDGAARLAEGNLAGSTLTMERAVRNMVERVGVPLEAALQMASLNPARSIGCEGGLIRPGARADLVLMNGGFDVLLTLVAGKTQYRANG